MNNTRLKIGKKIKMHRTIRGITQHQLAEMVGLTEKQISKIETGIHYPKFENFIKILEALNLSMNDFGTETKNNKNPALKSILKIVYSLDEEDLKDYLLIFKSIQKIKNKSKKTEYTNTEE